MYLIKPNFLKNILKLTIVLSAIVVISINLYMVYKHLK